MAFSKAKITRFNEITTCTPPPTAYDPKLERKVVGVVMKSSERFTDPPMSPAGSGASDTSSFKSIASAQCFKTPSMVRKKRNILNNKNDTKHSIEDEVLKEKIVECENKTQTIKDLEIHIEDLNDRIQSLVTKIKDIEVELINKTAIFNDELKLIKNEHSLEIEKIKEQYINKIQILEDDNKRIKEDLEYTNEIYSNIKTEYDNLNNKYRNQLSRFNENLLSIENERSDLTNDIVKLNKFIMQNTENTENLIKQEEILKNKLINAEKQINDIILKLQIKDEIIKNLQNELDFVKDELSDCKNEIERKVTIHESEIIEMELKQSEEIDILQRKIEELTESMNERDNRLTTSEATGCLLESELDEAGKEIEEIKNEYSKIMTSHVEMQKSHTEEIEVIKKLHQSEIEDIEFEMLKVVTDLYKKIENAEKDYLKKIKKIEEETNAKVKLAEENAFEKIKVAEIQMEEKCKQIELNGLKRLNEQEEQSEAILKECQAISEYNIIQCELEKKELSIKLSAVQKELESVLQNQQKIEKENKMLNNTVNDLQNKLMNVNRELNAMQVQNEMCFNELQKARIDKHKYSVTLEETRSTLEVLKKRLVESDKDVEQLKSELNILENEKFVCGENFLTDLQEEIVNTESRLNEQLEGYKTVLNLQINKLEDENKKLNDLLRDTLSQLAAQHQKCNEAHILINDARINIDKQESENIDMRVKINCLESNLSATNELLEKLKSENEKLVLDTKETEEKYNSLYEECSSVKMDNEKLKNQIKLQNEMIEPFKEQFEAYVAEKQSLLSSEYINDLKNKQNELFEEKLQLELRVRSQNKIIEKLKQELSLIKSPRKTKVLSTDKENASPGKVLNLSRVENSNATPLKNRNM